MLLSTRATGLRRSSPTYTVTWGELSIKGKEGNHDDGVLTRPLQADRPWPPFIEERHVLYKFILVLAAVQQTVLPRQFGRQKDTRQDLEHYSPRPKEEPGLLKPHVVLAAEQGPHWARMALKRSDPALDEFLHHHRCSYAAILQQPQPEPDVGKVGAREPLMALVGFRNSGP